MKAGYLSEFFSAVAVKTLSPVEADGARSHQHEFNGNKDLIRVFGRATGKHVFPSRFLYLTDGDPPLVEDASATWYDARTNHATRTEHRLYFPRTAVSQRARAGDVLALGKRQDGSVLVVIAEGESTVANQVQRLFRIDAQESLSFSIREEMDAEQDRIGFASTFILEQIGILVEHTEDTYLTAMLERFDGLFPSTRRFSEFARSTLNDNSDLVKDPDAALMAWMEREEILFRTLEKHLIGDRLARGFAGDPDAFLRFALSVLNRRKSRVGLALENHLECIFHNAGLRFERSAATEGKAKPDFLFPGAREYLDPTFDPRKLTMLGVKSTCKDRWRQVLTEASRIDVKHLLTLEPSISRDQTSQMRSQGIQLVLPKPLHCTYTSDQAAKLVSLGDFLALVTAQQKEACHSEERTGDCFGGKTH